MEYDGSLKAWRHFQMEEIKNLVELEAFENLVNASIRAYSKWNRKEEVAIEKEILIEVLERKRLLKETL